MPRLRRFSGKHAELPNKWKPEKTELLMMEPLQDITSLILHTAYCKESPTRPPFNASLLMLGERETGRTEMLKKFLNEEALSHGVVFRGRISGWGIVRDLTEYVKWEKGYEGYDYKYPPIESINYHEVKHIVTGDLARVISYNASSAGATIQLLDEMMEEGLIPHSDYSKSPSLMEPFRGLQVGLIAAINDFGFFKSVGKVEKKLSRIQRLSWQAGGFTGRPTPFSFDHSLSLQSRVLDSIFCKDGYELDFVNKFSFKFPSEPEYVEISNEHENWLREINDEIAEKIGEKGYRSGKNLRRLARASAIREHRLHTNDHDIERIEFLSYWMNWNMNFLQSSRISKFYEFNGM